jgi:hypothetical protein
VLRRALKDKPRCLQHLARTLRIAPGFRATILDERDLAEYRADIEQM